VDSSSLSEHFPRGAWFDLLQDEFNRPHMQKLSIFLSHERADWPAEVHPEPEDVFEAFRLTEWENVRVVVLGQDPYPKKGQATGLAFGVRPTAPLTASLRSVEAELGSRLSDRTLTCWAKQGVLLLNPVLTVFGPAGPGSHRRRGWECFTDVVLEKLRDQHPNDLVFLLWGKAAQKTATRLNLQSTSHTLLPAPHPASVRGQNRNGFVGSNTFKDANRALSGSKIDWACA
jgi:uracil-DNA glycosylase